MEKTSKASLLTVFITVFIDMLGVGLVIPVFGHLFLDSNGILPPGFELAKRTVLLGLLIASYPLAQFFGAPILGALSDRYGRKKILLISLVGTFIGYIVFAYGILTKNLGLLFISRSLDGFTGGNISTILSALADLSDPKEKAKNFGLVGMAFGLGFILGPFIGGKLADPTIISWFNNSTPFFFAALICLINIFMVILFFVETSNTRTHTNISIFTGFRNIRKALEMENLRTMFIVVFIMTFGFNFFTQFFQVFLIEKFSYSQSQIGNLFGYMGLWIAFTQGILTRKISKFASPEKVLKYSLFMLAIALPFLLVPSKAIYLFMIIPFISMSNGLTMPNQTAVVSNLSARDSQGEILGINQSIQSLGMAMPPLIAGFVISFNRNLPILISSASIFIAWLIFVFVFKGGKKEVFHEV
ncbi:MAG: MFS transporter [archaeon]